MKFCHGEKRGRRNNSLTGIHLLSSITDKAEKASTEKKLGGEGGGGVHMVYFYCFMDLSFICQMTQWK